jgi:hypothetical protein
MRTTLLSSILVLAAGAPAVASTVPKLDTSALPSSCQWTGDAQAHGHPAPLRLAAITSAANCMAIKNLSALTVEPTPDGAKAIDAAIAPSLALLDSVIASDNLEARLVATQAKADLLQGAAVKLASSVQPVGTMKGKDLATFEKRVDEATALAAPFRQGSTDTFQSLATMAQSTDAQQLAAFDPVVKAVLRDPRLAPSQVSRR